jgi:nucleoside-diphosphate-sugar epimerase
MKYLILGSEGKIGRHLSKFLLKEGHEIKKFDIVMGPEYDLRVKNELLTESLKWCDFVFFLAYDIGGANYIQKNQHSYNYIHNNVSIMKETFGQIEKFKKPFIFTSSEMTGIPASTYGLLKSLGDAYVKSLGGFVTKLWNVYCVESTQSEKSHAINDFVFMAIRDKVIKLRTNGQEQRQFLYGDDCAECLYALSKNYDKIDRSKEINIARFEWVSVLATAELIANYFGDVSVIPSDKLDATHNNIRIEPNPYVLEFWQPKTSLCDGIENIICESK